MFCMKASPSSCGRSSLVCLDSPAPGMNLVLTDTLAGTLPHKFHIFTPQKVMQFGQRIHPSISSSCTSLSPPSSSSPVVDNLTCWSERMTGGRGHSLHPFIRGQVQYCSPILPHLSQWELKVMLTFSCIESCWPKALVLSIRRWQRAQVCCERNGILSKGVIAEI